MLMIASIRTKIKKILQLDASPKRIATASAIGAVIGFSPYIGFHTVISIGISFVFNLPLYPLIVGAYITNPLTFIPIYTACYKFGELITGQQGSFPSDFSAMSLTTVFATAKSFIVPFFVGAHLLGLIIGVFTYILTYYLVKKYKDSV